MKNKAFTLIELLIVVTIIILITASSAVYFTRQIGSLALGSKLGIIVDIIDKLDSQVDNNIILDYSIIFDAGLAKQQAFIYSTNNIGLSSIQEFFSFDSKTGYGSLGTTITQADSVYFLKIYSGVKFLTESIIDGMDMYDFIFNSNDEYTITATLSGSTLNNIYIKYYGNYGDNYAKLIDINDEKDKTGSSYNIVEVKNIRGKKEIIGDGGIVSGSSIFLFFEDDGGEGFIEITK